MMNRRSFRSYQPMNMVYKSKQFNTELWLGDYYAATDFNLLKNKNIKSVLTAAAMLGVAYPAQLQMTHKTIHAFDMPSYKMTPHFQQAYQFIHQGLKKGNVLVHCAAGISRSTTCVLVYLMRTDGFTFNQAMQLVRGRRSIINPNYGFQNELKKYELKLKKLITKKQLTGQNNKNQSNFNNFNESEKKAVLNFLQQSQKSIERDKIENNNKFNTTVNYSNQQPIYSNYLRGQSVNISQKNQFGNTMGYTGNKVSGQQRLSSMSNTKYSQLKGVLNTFKPSDMDHLNKKLFSVKVQNPKIVTIKK